MAAGNEHGLGPGLGNLISNFADSVPLVLDFGGLTLRPHWEDESWINSPSELLNSDLSKPLTDSPNVAIYNHVFFPEVYQELLQACNELPRACHFVTTDSVEKAAAIQAMHGRWSCHRDLEIRVVPNRGRDLAPFLCAWGTEPANHPVVLHLHSKVSSYDPGLGTAWRRHMLQQLLGGGQRGTDCSRAIQNYSVGLIIPWPHPAVANCCHWGPNYQRSKQLLALLGLQLRRFQPLSFPAGSFFWCAGSILGPLLNLGLQMDHFASEPIGEDGGLPHALERCLGFLPSLVGLRTGVRKLDSIGFGAIDSSIQGSSFAAATEISRQTFQILPDPFQQEQKYSSVFEDLLQAYLDQRPELYGGQAAHIIVNGNIS